MAFEYIILKEAQQEYEEALYWYLERSFNAAENFVNAIDSTLSLICNHPFRWRNEVEDYYELNLKKYPFTVIYKIEPVDNLIIVTSIYHHKRTPVKKYKKS